MTVKEFIIFFITVFVISFIIIALPFILAIFYETNWPLLLIPILYLVFYIIDEIFFNQI